MRTLIYKCLDCGKIYHTKSSLIRHNKSKHTKSNKMAESQEMYIANHQPICSTNYDNVSDDEIPKPATSGKRKHSEETDISSKKIKVDNLELKLNSLEVQISNLNKTVLNLGTELSRQFDLLQNITVETLRTTNIEQQEYIFKIFTKLQKSIKENKQSKLSPAVLNALVALNAAINDVPT